jgi:hypothetical protein
VRLWSDSGSTRAGSVTHCAREPPLLLTAHTGRLWTHCAHAVHSSALALIGPSRQSCQSLPTFPSPSLPPNLTSAVTGPVQWSCESPCQS